MNFYVLSSDQYIGLSKYEIFAVDTPDPKPISLNGMTRTPLVCFRILLSIFPIVLGISSLKEFYFMDEIYLHSRFLMGKKTCLRSTMNQTRSTTWL